MSYPRKGCRNRRVRRRLPGIGRTPELNTKTPSKREADAMDRVLIEVGLRALTDPVHMKAIRKLFARGVDLPTLYVAHNFGTIAELVEDNLLLADAVREYQMTVTDHNIIVGLSDVERYAPPGVPFSWICNSLNITRLLEQRQAEGIKRNSTRRRTMRATSKLLTRYVGKAERNRIFADVDFPAEDDSREVYLSPVEIERLLGSCEGEFRTWVQAAIVTSGDRGVL